MMNRAILLLALAKASMCATGWRWMAKKAGSYFNQQIVEPIQGKNGPLGYLRLTLDTHNAGHRSKAGR
ncbi:membrane protein [Salmonella enterica subsp. enterica]|uniref:Membrane protein n=1 Tax=Salmonella enterica I TaxID=59201 RepID=A0A3S4LN99_SALET|nr:membrane protein [Salmonella enterica subsp. enterica]